RDSPDPVIVRSPGLPLLSGAAVPLGGAGSSAEMIAASLAGVRGRSTDWTPSASATALARQTGVDMQLPSPTPLAPNGVNGDGLSMWSIVRSGTSVAVGSRYSAKVPERNEPSSPYDSSS